MSLNNANEVDNHVFESLVSRYQIGLETSIKRAWFYFRLRSNVTRKVLNMVVHILILQTINPKNEDDKCFQYVVTATLNYVEIESHPEKCQILNGL